MKKICYIVGAGDVPEKKIIIGDSDYIICADAGYKHMGIFSRQPDLVIGDFDSLGAVPDFENKIVLPPEKDDTDMTLAVSEGIKKGYDTFVIFGGLGGERMDHSIANIQLLHFICEKGCIGFLVNGSRIFTAIKNRKASFSNECEGYISVFSLTDKSDGVTIKNLKYELSDYTMKNSAVLGVSNEFIGEKAEIEVKNGVLLLSWQGSFTDLST